jgi:hypothetical protein
VGEFPSFPKCSPLFIRLVLTVLVPGLGDIFQKVEGTRSPKEGEVKGARGPGGHQDGCEQPVYRPKVIGDEADRGGTSISLLPTMGVYKKARQTAQASVLI